MPSEMDVYFDLKLVTNTIREYNEIIHTMKETGNEILKSRASITQREWSGEGKESFCDTVDLWLKHFENVLAEICDTRNILLEYAGEEASKCKVDCERFKDSL